MYKLHSRIFLNINFKESTIIHNNRHINENLLKYLRNSKNNNEICFFTIDILMIIP